MLISAVRQGESVICIHITPPLWPFLPFNPPYQIIPEHWSELPVLFSSFPLLLLLLLSRFSRVRLCATPWMAAHQAPPSLGFSRQEHWSGLPFPSPMHENESESEVAQSCRLFVTPWTVAYQVPLSMGFSRQEYWGGVSLPSLSFLLSIYKIFS